MRDSRRARHHTFSEILVVAKPRTAPPSAPNTVQDSKPAAAAAVTEEKPADPATAELNHSADVDNAAASGSADGQPLESTENDPVADAGSNAPASALAAISDANGAADAGAGLDAGVHSHDDDAPARVCFEVLTPFKFRGSVLKPPAWLEISEDDAAIYQAAGVLGTEPAEPFDHV